MVIGAKTQGALQVERQTVTDQPLAVTGDAAQDAGIARLRGSDSWNFT